MAFYEFEDKRGRKRVIRCAMSGLTALVERMKREGWRRLLSVPYYHSVPGYREALEETDRVMASEDRKMANDRREAKVGLARAVKEEYGG